jgi:hypothetical protein
VRWLSHRAGCHGRSEVRRRSTFNDTRGCAPCILSRVCIAGRSLRSGHQAILPGTIEAQLGRDVADRDLFCRCGVRFVGGERPCEAPVHIDRPCRLRRPDRKLPRRQLAGHADRVVVRHLHPPVFGPARVLDVADFEEEDGVTSSGDDRRPSTRLTDANAYPLMPAASRTHVHSI